MTNTPTCYKCGSTKGLVVINWARTKAQCQRCSEVPKHQGSPPKRKKNELWDERARLSRGRILSRHK